MRANRASARRVSYEPMGKVCGSLAGGDRGAADEGGDGGRRSSDRWGEDFRRRAELPAGVAHAGSRAWRRSRQPKRSLEAAQRGPTMSAGASLGRTAIPGAGGPTSGPTGEPAPKAQSNFTDPESRIMKTSSEGCQQCYKRRDGGRSSGAPIIARLRWGHRPATGQLNRMLDEINETFGVEPAVVLRRCGLLQRAGSAGAGRSRHRRAR